MDKKEKQFVEQEAPLKNTDKAFVQVNKDSSPLMPDPGKQQSAGSTRKRRAGRERQ